VYVKGASGERVIMFGSAKFQGRWFRAVPDGETIVDLQVPHLPLAIGRYALELVLSITHQWLDWVEDAAYFDVVESDPGGAGLSYWQGEGFVHVDHTWTSRVQE
jgi:hypothetical protein